MDNSFSLTTITKTSAKIIFGTITIFILGTFLSWFLGFLLSDEWYHIFSIGNQTEPFFQKLLWISGGLVGIVLYAVLFPIVFFFLGKWYAVQRTSRMVFLQSKSLFLTYYLEKVFLFLAQNETEKASYLDNFLDLSEPIARKALTIPLPLRWMFESVFNQVALLPLMKTSISKANEEHYSQEELASLVAKDVSQHLSETLFLPDYSFLYITLGSMLALFLFLTFMF